MDTVLWKQLHCSSTMKAILWLKCLCKSYIFWALWTQDGKASSCNSHQTGSACSHYIFTCITCFSNFLLGHTIYSHVSHASATFCLLTLYIHMYHMNQPLSACSHYIFTKMAPKLWVVKFFTVSILGRDEGYTVKYTLCLKEFLRDQPEESPECKGLYLTIYLKSSPNMDSIRF